MTGLTVEEYAVRLVLMVVLTVLVLALAILDWRGR